MNSAKLTQEFSTWGGKLLQHAGRLAEIQEKKIIRPITIQLAPTELCDSDCTFCSVGNRPKGKIPFDTIRVGLLDFVNLGAKSLEITGGGNPLLYRDGNKTINDVVEFALMLGLKVGVITNSENPSRHLSPDHKIDWIRVSLAKLDEGKTYEDFDFTGFKGRLGLSYIIHDRTTSETIRQMANLVEHWPEVKFVRVAADCTTEESLTIEEKWGPMIQEIDQHGKFFIKEIGGNFHPFQGGCWVGGIRPYWTSTGVYICTSHVLKTRKYEDEWKLCEAHEIFSKWEEMSDNLKSGKPPYDIDISHCFHCYYYNNNEILGSVIRDLPDKEFA